MNRIKREQLICDAAVNVFARAGFERASVSEIIDEAQVARGTFYLYFKNKREVLSAILDRFLLEISKTVATHCQGNESSFDNPAHHNRWAQALVGLVTKNRLIARIILSERGILDRKASGDLENFFSKLSMMMARQLQDLYRRGIIRNVHSEVLAQCVLGAAKEMAREVLLKDDPEISSKIDSMVDLFCNGLIPQELSLEKNLSEDTQRPVAAVNLTNWH